jgi:hypothetical protein
MFVKSHLVGNCIDAHLNFSGTKWTGVEILVELVATQVILFTVLVKLGDKFLLGYEEFPVKFDVRRFQKVCETTRNHCDLFLNRLEVFGDDVPNILVSILTRVIEVPPDAFEKNNR